MKRRKAQKNGKRRGTEVREPVGVADFKAHCLAYVDAVDRKGARYVITKHGKAVARIEPVGSPRPLRGLFRDQLVITGDIVNVDWTDEWEAAR